MHIRGVRLPPAENFPYSRRRITERVSTSELARAAFDVRPIVSMYALAAVCSSGCVAPRPPDRIVIRHARVFDGERILPGQQMVVIANGIIQDVSSEAPSDTTRDTVDAEGRVLIPGLFDSHMHAGDGAGVLQQQLIFGVTTSLGMYDDPGVARKLRVETDDGSAFKSAGLGATAVGGHGTEYGGPVPTLARQDDADEFVEQRAREGSDFLKIIVGPPRMPMLPEASIAALVSAAHRRGRLAVAHVDRLSEARIAVRAGVDGLVHIFCDEVADDRLVSDMVARKVFVIPTLTIRQAAVAGSEWRGDPASFLMNPAVSRYLTSSQRKDLAATFKGNEEWQRLAAENVAKLARGGVAILAGSDAPNPGTAWGASLHQELELLVAAGLSPADALSAATSRPAARFGFEDRGYIRPRMRADLVLLDCDPLANMTCSSRIASVWKRGIHIERRSIS